MTGTVARPGPAGAAPRAWRDSEALLCDEMLGRLARWLRAAGYDTALADHRGRDRDLVARAAAERRTLLTRDRKILEVRDAGARTLLLAGNGLIPWVAETSAALGLDWLKAPFTRCLLCNRRLDAPGPEMLDRLPAGARGLAPAATWCPGCGKLYWPGGHVRRMRARLADWAAGRYL